MKRVLVLFDIDGTLLLSGGAGRRSILRALVEETGTGDHDLADVRFDGKTDPQIAGELLAATGVADPNDSAAIDRLLGRYLGYLTADLAENAHQMRVMPGVPELLDLVEADASVLLGLLTGNHSAGAELKLRAAAFEPTRFRIGAYGSDDPDRSSLPAIAVRRASPHFGRPPAGREVVIIGDTPADVTCGAAIGAASIGVATGRYSVAELRAAGASAAFEDFRDASRVCQTIHELAA